ncbi:MAG TPA: DUF6801 domain-containing protein [Ornithinibacter sp.]|nr:DUF6801 domain-containing protein [Ornithinibacter sp.]
MKSTAGIAARSALVAAVVAVVALTAVPAGADSGTVAYECTYSVGIPDLGGTTGAGAATGSFDTGIPDGLVVELGEPVSATPFTGRLTLPDGLIDALHAADVTSISGGEHAEVAVLPGAVGDTWTYFDEVPVPAEGSVSVDLHVNGDWSALRFDSPGVHTLAVGRLEFVIQGPGARQDVATLTCDAADDDVDVVVDGSTLVSVDTIEVAGPTTPAPGGASSGATPVRPVLVQTDFAEADAGVGPPSGVAALAAFVALAAGAVGLTRLRGRAASRRH